MAASFPPVLEDQNDPRRLAGWIFAYTDRHYTSVKAVHITLPDDDNIYLIGIDGRPRWSWEN